MRRATVILVSDEYENILLLKRHLDHPLFPGQWCFPGGKVEMDEAFRDELTQTDFIPDITYVESVDACAWRELKEETGIKARSLVRPAVTLFDDHYEVTPFITTTKLSGASITVAFPNREHTEYGWFPRQNFPQNTSKMVYDLLDTLDILF